MPDRAPPPALIEAELQRLACSAAFRRSPRHVRFLRHLLQATLRDDNAALREMVIGVQVFLRSAARFNPRHDTIVRVEARRLRHKLQHYYADEGVDARLEFQLPVGGYRLRWRLRDTAETGQRRRLSLAVHELSTGGDAAATPMAALLSAELGGVVARLNGLRVVAAGAPRGSDAAALARDAEELDVDSVLLGSVHVRSTRVQLSLRLLRCGDGSVLWQRQTEVAAGQALQALEPLARGIVSALHRDAAQRQLQRIRLAGSLPYVHALAGGGPTVEGLEWLALARVAMRANTLDAYRKAVQLAEQACTAMPAHAPAFALLAEALIACIGWTLLPARPALESAQRAAERALELDPAAADALGVLGEITFRYRRDWPAAEALLLRALQLAPGLAGAHARYGFALMMHRRFDEARLAYSGALALDPLSLLYRCHQALIAFYEMDWPLALSTLDRVLDVSPQHVLALALRAATQLCAGDTESALAGYEALHARWPRLTIGRCGRAQAHALRGDRAAACADLQSLQAAFAAGDASPYQIAMVHTRLGDAPAAVHWLRLAAEQGDANFVCAAADPSLHDLRGRPDFAALLADAGLAPPAAAP